MQNNPGKKQAITLTDEQLVSACRADSGAGNAAFYELVNRYMEKVYHHCRSICGNHEDADDAAQNTFIKMWQNLEKFRGDSQFYTWLYRIATNESLTVIRKKKPDISLDDLLPNAEPMGEITGLSENQATFLLEKAVAALPLKQRLVFNLKYYEELSYQDIAEITGTSEGALKASYHHAVKKIEEIVQRAI